MLTHKSLFMDEKKTWRQRIKGTRGYEIMSAFIKSAAVALLFAAVCFIYDVYHDSEQDKQLEASIEKLENIENSVEQLEKIKQSLSTRYLGIFPEYITEINALFENLIPSDSVIIFEDVLYYGIKSRPNEFYNLNVQLFNHALNDGSLTVAYYDDHNSDNNPVMDDLFHKMIIESRISQKFHADLNESRKEELQRLSQMNQLNIMASRYLDSTLCEKYFVATRKDDPVKFKKDVEAYLGKELIDKDTTNFSQAEMLTYRMCVEIDSVKQHFIGNGKPIESILFSDYEQMYRGMSEIIAKHYAKQGFVLVPLDEYLTMSCWMVREGSHKGVKTVLAFPSKYSSDEIGFYSQDEAFSKYIGTMLEGVRQNKEILQNN